MAEYITKEQALQAFEKAERLSTGFSRLSFFGHFGFELAVIPTADVVEVAHAYWDGVAPVVHAEDENGEMQIVYDVFECSRCGCVHLGSPNARWEYCPDCGARMDLELPMCEKEGEGK